MTGSIFWEDVTVLIVCASNSKASKYMEQKLRDLRWEIDKYCMLAGDFTSCSQLSDHTTEGHQGPRELNHTISQQGLSDIYRRSHAAAQNSHAFQDGTVTMQTLHWAIKQISTDHKESRSYQVYFPTIVKLNQRSVTYINNNRNVSRYLEIK